MTTHEDRQLQGTALLELAEARQRLNLIREKAAQWGEVMQRLGHSMKTEPDNVAIESYQEWFDYERFSETIVDARESIRAVQDAEEKCRKLGCPPTSP